MGLEKIHTLSKEFENSLLESNSKHTSFYTVNLKHSGVDTRRKTHLWLDRVFKHVSSAACKYKTTNIQYTEWCGYNPQDFC